MTYLTIPAGARKLTSLFSFMDTAYLRDAMAEGPAGASGPDTEAKARLLVMAGWVLCLPLLLVLMA